MAVPKEVQEYMKKMGGRWARHLATVEENIMTVLGDPGCEVFEAMEDLQSGKGYYRIVERSTEENIMTGLQDVDGLLWFQSVAVRLNAAVSRAIVRPMKLEPGEVILGPSPDEPLTVLDKFAAAIAVGLGRACAEQAIDDYGPREVAHDAYNIAEAMAAEKKRRETMKGKG